MKIRNSFSKRISFLLIIFMLGCISMAAQSIQISGVVKLADGEPVIGGTVGVKGTTIGVITDLDGKYYISVPSKSSVLVFSYVGSITQEIVADKNEINVILQEASKELDEIVVVGYGVQKKATLSGAVTAVSGKEILKSPALNVGASLAGSLPGLSIVTDGGEPGAESLNMYIRGLNSLNNNGPLIVVDGVPGRSLERIDPSTIDNISILKDASSAIYGAQAANGVIMVTTKRGKVEKTQISASFSAGISSPTKLPKLTSSAEYAELVNEVNYYRGENPKYTQTQIDKYRDGSDPWRYPNSDWFDLVLKTQSLQTNANVSISGGNEFIQSFVSVSTRFQDGYFHNSASNYKQHDLRANVDGKVNKYIKLGADVNLRLEQRNFPVVSSARIFRNLMFADPTKQAVWPNGLPGPPMDIQTNANPVVQSTKEAGYDQGDNYVININGKIEIDIPWVQGLKITGNAAIDRNLDYSKKFMKQYALYEWDGVALDNNNLPLLNKKLFGDNPSLSQQLDVYKRHLLSGLMNYNRTFDEKHDVNILAGVETIVRTSNWFRAERKNFSSPFPEELNFGDPAAQYANGSNPGEDKWLNYLGRVNYAYQSKYIAEFVWRYQGTSIFGPRKRWGFFPGLSVGYRISEEGFWKESSIGKAIENLKFRASCGKTGNDQIAPYQFYSLYAQRPQPNFVDGLGIHHPTYYESLSPNLAAQWEEADQYNVGFDISTLKNRLTVTADYFNYLRSKILIPQSASIPDFTGLPNKLPDVNLGEVRNHGFDFEIAWNDKIGDLIYRVGLNGGYAKNKVLFFDEAEGALPWQKQTGYPMHSQLYYQARGIYHTQADVDKWNQYAKDKTGDPAAEYMTGARPGDIFFEDINGDGVITGEDKIRIYKNTVPRYTGGFNLQLQYRGIDFSMLLQGQAGAVRYVQPIGSRDEINYLKSSYDGRWTENNTGANKPRIFNRNEEYWVSSENQNTFWLKKTDFIRLKNIELGYTLPNSLVSKIGLNHLRFNITGMNLLTLSPDMKDFDPESGIADEFVGSAYPIQKTITFGIQTKF